MYQVLLVDDDLIVRMFLKDVLEWEKFGFQVAGEARDGEEAYKAVDDLRPDVILTDISMPRMSGVELIRRLREDGYDGVIIALSCHDDFDLVKSAMKYGADEYFLKNHLSEDSFGEMLQSLRTRVEKHRNDLAELRQMKMLAREGERSRQREVLNRLLDGSIPEGNLQQTLCEAGFAGEYRRCAMLLFQLVGADGGQMHNMSGLCVQHITDDSAEFWELSGAVGAVVLKFSDTPSIHMQEERIHALCSRIESLAARYLDLQVVVAVSAVCEGTDALARALRQAYRTLPCGFYQPGIYRYGEDGMTEMIPAAADEFAHGLERLLSGCGSTEIETAYYGALDTFPAARTSPGSVQEWLRRCDRAANVRRKESFYASLQWFSQYRGCVREYLVQQEILKEKQLTENVAPAVQKAVRYIQEHYAEPIGLRHTARAVDLAPTYLSSLFKKEMRTGFAEYLLGVRLEHVKSGLRNTSITVKELSEQAGFSDYQHFCKTFKKKVGQSPREYRRKLKEKEPGRAGIRSDF